MISIEDVWTAIDRGYEYIADVQFEAALYSGISGDTFGSDREFRRSAEVLIYIEALEELNLDYDIVQNKIIERLYNNIKGLIKNIK